MRKYFKYIILFFLIFIIPNIVYADDYSVALSCPSTVLPSENIECVISVVNSDFDINKLSADVSYTGGITGDNSVLMENEHSKKLNLTIPEDASSNTIYTITLNNIIANETVNTASASTSIRVKSSDNNLKSMTIEGATIDFDPNVTNYDVIIDGDRTVIGAVANDIYANVNGTGEKNLDYGVNSFDITVTSETNRDKKYNINITRPDTRNRNNDLSSLMVTNTNIDFNKNKTEYDLTTTSSDIIISAIKEDSKASISGDIGKKSLSYGLNTYKITVTSENNLSKTYTLNITRKDIRSNNNYLKNITLSSGNIKFDKYTTTYNIDVDKNTSKIKISATLDDYKSSFVEDYSSKEVTLKPGNNVFYIKVLNEKKELRTYTLNINRDDGRDSNSKLKKLTINDIKFNFSSDTFAYKISVKNSVKSIKINAVPYSNKSKVTVDGKEDLKVGNNLINIIVEAENGATSTYKIIINRKNNEDELSSNYYIKELTIKDYDFVFNKYKYSYDVTTDQDSLDIGVTLEDENATYKIIGNNNLKNKSKIIIRVTAENSKVKDYTIVIHKTSKVIVILLMIFTTLIATGLIYLVVLNMKKRLIHKNMYGSKIEIIDEDFTIA